jgi:ATP-dependent Lon protease
MYVYFRMKKRNDNTTIKNTRLISDVSNNKVILSTESTTFDCKKQSISNKLIYDEIIHIQEIIQNTVLSIQYYNNIELFSNNDTNLCIQSLLTLFEKSKKIIEDCDSKNVTIDVIIDKLQSITNDLTQIISKHGTTYIKDVLYILFGSDFIKNKKLPLLLQKKMELIQNNTQPIGFKIMNNKTKKTKKTEELCINKDTEDTILMECSPQLECFDVEITQNFFKRVHGIHIIIHNEDTNKTLIIFAIIDNINIDFFSNEYIDKRKELIKIGSQKILSIDSELLQRQIDSLCVKDILVRGNEDIFKKNIFIQNFIKTLKTTKLEVITKKFILLNNFAKRNELMDMLLCIKDSEIQYLAYLLYDLLTNIESNNDDFNDSTDQIEIYNSFSWRTKNKFKDAMKNTLHFNQNILNKYENTAVSLEQQIIFWRVPENIKDRAFLKLKEFKGKMDDSGSKAKQYLEGLLRIPFETYRREPVLQIIDKINENFEKIIKNKEYNVDEKNIISSPKQKYTNIEIQEYCKKISLIQTKNIKDILKNIQIHDLKIIGKICSLKQKNKQNLIDEIYKCIESPENSKKINDILINNIMNTDSDNKPTNKSSQNQFQLLKQIKCYSELKDVSNTIYETKTMIQQIRDTLDESIYGHNYAKKQIMKIIGQWMNGSQSGYCFGFEGSPGIGKTSLAKKGLSKCLSDEEGIFRPFSFIALGGSCNGSTFEGHSYTYLNSTWGRIADILMESKCMNPIIYIDELDKVSKSEHGKEIIGILTHLIDSTQNDNFQDKYFSGIHLDLSKALFIFSYNDPDQIDRILLDRIHRIKFDNLTLQEKIVIVSKYILPDINTKMGFCEIIELNDNIIQHIIENYTSEPGVRKLKEILFDLYGEINIEILEGNEMTIPVKIVEKDLEKYLKKYRKITELKIHKNNLVGIMNGLWANAMGNGGIIPIETMYFPSENFLELKLTGLQGDVMKESMNVAKTLVWSLCTNKQQKIIIKNLKNSKTQGIHIHCPEGAVSKDGPSAGAAIVISIYSLINNIPIKNDVAITGEISLQGNITAIGGLEHKLYGGIRAGVTRFLFPEENKIDFENFIQKMIEQQYILSENDVLYDYSNKKYEIIFTGKKIDCFYVSNIHEVFTHVFHI